jgi:hypothetical protein
MTPLTQKLTAQLTAVCAEQIDSMAAELADKLTASAEGKFKASIAFDFRLQGSRLTTTGAIKYSQSVTNEPSEESADLEQLELPNT